VITVSYCNKVSQSLRI